MGYRKKRKVFFSKHCKHQPSTASLKEKMGAQPGGQLGQVHESRWCQNHGKTRQQKQCVTGGYTLPYCTLNVSGSLIEWTAGHSFSRILPAVPGGESYDPHESPGTSSASWCVMPLAALHTWSFWGRCPGGPLGHDGPLGNIELGLNEWDLGVSYSWTKPRNLDLPCVCYFYSCFLLSTDCRFQVSALERCWNIGT